MERITKILFFFVLLLTVVSVAASFYKFVILEDYFISMEVDCDPESESCFVWVCDPEVDGEDYCTGDPEEDTWYYKYLEGTVTDMCSNEDEDCDVTSCLNDPDSDCEEILCEEYADEETGEEVTCAYFVFDNDEDTYEEDSLGTLLTETEDMIEDTATSTELILEE